MQPRTYNDLSFAGPLAAHMANYIKERRALGYMANTEAKKLREFSQSSGMSCTAEELTEEAVMRWIARRPNDATASVRLRYAVIRGFAEYLRRQGVKAFKPERSGVRKMPRYGYVPHIFSYAEVLRFFTAIDERKNSKYSNSRNLTEKLRIIFRLLYCCGFRISEVLNLTLGDYDAASGVVTVRDAKFNKHRYVPLGKEMSEALNAYVDTFRPEHYLFPATDGGPYAVHSIYQRFREILYDANIPFEGKGKGPRVHDFRHTFAVHNLVRWMRSERDLSTVLPRLSTYLGHNDLTATERYLRLSFSIYPELSKRLENEFGNIIPKE